jgi:hypothetical protein
MTLINKQRQTQESFLSCTFYGNPAPNLNHGIPVPGCEHCSCMQCLPCTKLQAWDMLRLSFRRQKITNLFSRLILNSNLRKSTGLHQCSKSH